MDLKIEMRCENTSIIKQNLILRTQHELSKMNIVYDEASFNRCVDSYELKGNKGTIFLDNLIIK